MTITTDRREDRRVGPILRRYGTDRV